MKIKNNLFKITALCTAFTLGIGIAVHTNAPHKEVDATQYTGNYNEYTYSGDYYNTFNFDAAEGLNGALRTTLTTLIKPDKFFEYSGSGAGTLSEELQEADQDPNNSNNMVIFYTRDSIGKTAAGSGTSMVWNREHVWCQSLSNGNWGESQGGTDLLHLRPDYPNTNSSRGNTPYGDINKSSPKYYDPVQKKVVNDSSKMLFGYSNGTWFEPLDCVKGDVARIIMYTWTAYTGWSGYSPLNIKTIFQSYDTLLKWHTMDRPDALEGHRNDYVQSTKQKNRNPFVDHPELAWKIFGDSAEHSSCKDECMAAYPANGGTPIEPTGMTLNQTTASVEINKTLRLTATLQPSGATGTISWKSNNTSVATVNGGTVTGVSAGNATITAYIDANGNASPDANEIKAQCVVTVTEPEPLSPLTESIDLDYSSLTAKGTELSANEALTVVGLNNSHIESIEVSKIYNGNGSGGAYPNTAGLLKTGTSSAAGRIGFVLDGLANKVEILCHDFNQSTGSNSCSTTVSVTNSNTQTPPFNTTATFGTLTFDLDEATNEITIDINNRIFIKEIHISYDAPVAETFTVTFDSNGGSTVNSQTVQSGNTVQEPTAPTKASDGTYNYSFIGWFRDLESNDAYDFDTPVTEDFTLYAKWERTEIPAKNIIANTLTTSTSLSYSDYTQNGNGTVVDTLNATFTGRTGTTYGDWTRNGPNSGITYKGQSAADYDSIQLRSKNSNSGIVTTTSVGNALSVTVAWNSNTDSGRTLDIFGSNTAYSNPTDLYDNSTKGTKIGSIVCGTGTSLTITDDYEYIGIRSNSGALYLDSIEIEWGDPITYSYTDVAIRFGGKINPTLWNRLDEESHIEGFGVLLAVGDLGNDSIEAWYSAYKNESNTVQQAIDELESDGIVEEYYKSKEQKPHPTQVGDVYSWNLYFEIGDTRAELTTAYTAVAYIRIQNSIVFLQEDTVSAQSLAADLINDGVYEEDAFGGSLYYMSRLQPVAQ